MTNCCFNNQRYTYNNNVNNSIAVTLKKITLKPGNRVFSSHTQYTMYHKTFIVIDCCKQFIFILFTQTSAELLEDELSDADVTEDSESDASTKTGG